MRTTTATTKRTATAAARRSASTTASPAPSRSTRSSTSTSRRSAGRRAPTRRPTSRCSTRSARCSPSCPRRRCAATSRAGSASTSRAAAARRARATAPTASNMDFLADVWVTCPVCEGRRFNRETLQVRFKGKSIHDVLEMDVQEALVHFQNVPKIRADAANAARRRPRLHQARPARPDALRRRGPAHQAGPRTVPPGTGTTLYILDEPTTGLHFEDIQQAAASAARLRRRRQHGPGHRAQSGRHQDGRLAHRPRPRGRQRTAARSSAVGTPEEVAAVRAVVHRPGAAARSSNGKPTNGKRPKARRAARPRRPPPSRLEHADGPGRAAAQPQERHRRAAARADDGLLRPQRLRQEFAGPGHHLRRGPAALHRIAVGLRPAVPRPDAEAEGRARQRPVAGHQHRAEDDQQKPALDRRHRHRDLRLSAHPLRPPRPAATAPPAASPSARRRPTRSSTRSCRCRRGPSST